MTHNRYYPFKDHDDYANAQLDGRLLLWKHGGHAGHVMPGPRYAPTTTTAPIHITKEMVDEVIEEAAQRNREARIAQLETEIAEETASIAEQERDVAYLTGLCVGLST